MTIYAPQQAHDDITALFDAYYDAKKAGDSIPPNRRERGRLHKDKDNDEKADLMAQQLTLNYAKRGDYLTQETLGSLELNRIYQMDCIEGMRLLPDDSVDLVVTSPPYFNAREYSQWPTYDDFLLFLRRVFVETYRVTKAGRMVAVNFSVIIVPRSKRSEESRRIALPFHFVSLMEEIGFKFLEDIIWVKPEGAAKNRNGGFYQHRQPVAYKPNVINEYILIFQKPMNGLIDRIVRSYSGEIKEKSLVLGEYERSNVWYINPETKVNHPAPFPVELPEKLIRYYSYVRDVVLDPFMGSGTTAVAATSLGRNFIGFEREPEYVEIIEARTHVKAIKGEGEAN